MQWKNAEVFSGNDTFVVRVPAFIDDRAADLVASALSQRLTRELRHSVAVEVEGGNPGSIAISLEQPPPMPDLLAKEARAAMDEAYAQAAEAHAEARKYEQQLRTLENSFPTGAEQ